MAMMTMVMAIIMMMTIMKIYHYIFRRKMGRLTRDVTVARDISKVNVLLVIVHLMAMVVVIILMIIVVVVMVVMDDDDDGKNKYENTHCLW